MSTTKRLEKSDGEAVRSHIAKYSKADDTEALKTLGYTFGPLVVVVTLFYKGWLPFWALFVFMLMFHVRCFIIFHDMAHNSFFSKPAWNSTAAYLMGAFSFTSAARWRRKHNYHHSISGRMDLYDNGQTIFLTKKAYDELPVLKKILFRVLREPVVFFLLVAPSQQVFFNPIIVGDAATRIGLFLYSYWAYSVSPWLALSACLSATAGFILFHLQHAVNQGYKRKQHEWDEVESSLCGSTMLQVPLVFQWMTLGIEYHHIHHFSTQVPCYKLARCHDEAPANLWRAVTFVPYSKSLASIGNALYDEANQQYIPF